MSVDGLTHEDWLNIYYWMRLTFAVEDRMLALYRLGKILGGYYTGRGHEAITVGSAYALRKEAGLILPEEIRERRLHADLSQEALARYLKVAKETVSRWETLEAKRS